MKHCEKPADNKKVSQTTMNIAKKYAIIFQTTLQTTKSVQNYTRKMLYEMQSNAAQSRHSTFALLLAADFI